jgi:hypothetical protein
LAGAEEEGSDKDGEVDFLTAVREGGRRQTRLSQRLRQ